MSHLERKPYNHRLENMTKLTETVRQKINAIAERVSETRKKERERL